MSDGATQGERIDVVLVAGGVWHDFDYARLELLKLLAEHEEFRVRCQADFEDTAWLPQLRALSRRTRDRYRPLHRTAWTTRHVRPHVPAAGRGHPPICAASKRTVQLLQGNRARTISVVAGAGRGRGDKTNR